MTRKTSTSVELAWSHAAHDIPASGLSVEREATAEDLAKISGALDLLSCTGLHAAYSIKPTQGQYRLTGRLIAQISQACVVTLETIDSTIEETFEAMFWPEEEMPAPDKGELVMDDEPEREPIIAGQIDVGRVVFETLASAIDPFPKKPGAVLDWTPPGPADDADRTSANPFAVLANLKSKS